MNTDKIFAEKVANDYAPKKTTKVVALKKLDNLVKKPAYIFAWIYGIIFTLVFGTGMCLAMRVIGSGNQAFILGIVIGVISIIALALNYPIYQKILKARKEKYAQDIINLANEIIGE